MVPCLCLPMTSGKSGTCPTSRTTASEPPRTLGMAFAVPHPQHPHLEAGGFLMPLCHCTAFTLSHRPKAAHVLTVGPLDQEYHSHDWCAYIRRKYAGRAMSMTAGRMAYFAPGPAE